jgi:hypothetical protein
MDPTTSVACDLNEVLCRAVARTELTREWWTAIAFGVRLEPQGIVDLSFDRHLMGIPPPSSGTTTICTDADNEAAMLDSQRRPGERVLSRLLAHAPPPICPKTCPRKRLIFPSK